MPGMWSTGPQASEAHSGGDRRLQDDAGCHQPPGQCPEQPRQPCGQDAGGERGSAQALPQ
eukprot:1056600-Alexandrium_andersonii.AAC.1